MRKTFWIWVFAKLNGLSIGAYSFSFDGYRNTKLDKATLEMPKIVFYMASAKLDLCMVAISPFIILQPQDYCVIEHWKSR